ncbi:MAG: capsular biosynthesis protein [Porticoccaceae bacterium]|nr:capsular biosynthesis protein [Porticoccaceae bacterium]
MIDLHCHLLPGIDDGSKNMENSLAMARVAVDDGITHAVMTPHIHPGRWDNTTAIIAEHSRQFTQALRQHNINLTIGFAAEVRLSDLIFQQLERGDIPFLGHLDGFQIMLLEFPHSHIIPGSEKLVAWLIRNNIRPVIAHPERNKEIMSAPERLQPFLDQGCFAQVTAGSLSGRFGENARRAALYFIDHNQADFIASDAHNLSSRPPAIAEAEAIVAARLGQEVARKLVFDTPWQLAASQFENAING